MLLFRYCYREEDEEDEEDDDRLDFFDRLFDRLLSFLRFLFFFLSSSSSDDDDDESLSLSLDDESRLRFFFFFPLSLWRFFFASFRRASCASASRANCAAASSLAWNSIGLAFASSLAATRSAATAENARFVWSLTSARVGWKGT